MKTLNQRNSILVVTNNMWTVKKFRSPLIQKLISKKFQVQVVAAKGIDCKEPNFLQGKFISLPINRASFSPIRDLVYVVKALVILLRHRPALVVTFTIKPNIYFGAICRLLSIRYISMITGLGSVYINKQFLTSVISLFYRFSLKNSYEVWFTNTADLELFKELGIIKLQKTQLVPGCGVSSTTYYPGTFRSSGNIRFLMVSRIQFDKGVFEFLTAAQTVTKTHNNVSFTLVGSFLDDDYSSIRRCDIQHFFNEDRIDYLGEVSDMPTLYRNFDCFILPSYREGLSTVLAEAAMSGLPLLASNVPGCIELIDEGKNGFLFESQSSSALTDSIFNFLSLSQEKRLRFSQHSRAKACATVDLEYVTNKQYKTIRKAVKA